MNPHLAQIMQMANLEIMEYNMETRREMGSFNRKIPYYIMSYLKEGSAVLKIGGQKYQTGPGSIVIIPENVEHSHYKTDGKPTTFLWWHFSFKIQYTVDALKILNFPVVSYLKDREGFEKIFCRFYDGHKEMNKLSELLMHRACGLELVAYLVEELIAEKRLGLNANVPKAFWSIFQLVNSQENQQISLHALAERYHMSPTYISNRFKHYFGCSPIAMRNNIIFERSKLMLQNSDMSVSEIAERSGFENITSFTHFFTHRAKISPTEYRSTSLRLHI